MDRTLSAPGKLFLTGEYAVLWGGVARVLAVGPRVHALVRPRTDSPAETELRLDVMAHGLPEPQVNLDIFDAHGRRIAIGDLAYPEYCVLVEYDGEQHRTDDAQYARDVDRLDDLARAGWRVVRVNRSHRGIRRTARLERVREALLAAGWTPNAK